VAVSILTTSGALAAAVSLNLTLKAKKKDELNAALCELERIKTKVDYLVSCSGNSLKRNFMKLSRFVKISNLVIIF